MSEMGEASWRSNGDEIVIAIFTLVADGLLDLTKLAGNARSKMRLDLALSSSRHHERRKKESFNDELHCKLS